MSRILLLLGQYDISWDVKVRTQGNSTIPLSNAHELQFDGPNFGDNLFLGIYSDSLHVLAPDLSHQCVTDHPKNTKIANSTTYLLNGASSGSLPLPVPLADTPVSFAFTSAAAVSTNAALVYAVDPTDTGGMPNSSFQMVEGGTGTTWQAANGPFQALRLADQSSSTSHSFDIAVCMARITRGLQTGKLKLTFNFV